MGDADGGERNNKVSRLAILQEVYIEDQMDLSWHICC